jgi:hypothetical protein
MSLLSEIQNLVSRMPEDRQRRVRDFAASIGPESAKPAAKAPKFRRLSAARQERLDYLADRCNDGALTPDERAEYDAFVLELNQLTLDNAEALLAAR